MKALLAEALGMRKDVQLDLYVTMQQKALVATLVVAFMMAAMYLLATVPPGYA